MKTKPASPIVQLALDHLNALTLARQGQIADAGRQADGVGEEWLLDPAQGVWVLPDPEPTTHAMPARFVRDDAPQPGGKPDEDAASTGHS